ncbi:MAG: hypothetical protein ABR503_03955 [Chitinophagaceae bacterium]
MHPATITGIIASFVLLLPVLIIVVFRLYKNISLCSLLFYYLGTGVYNLSGEGIISLNQDFKKHLGIINNYLDVPLMLIVLLLFCTSKRKQIAIYISLVGFILFEIFIGVLFQFKKESLVYILGPGILLIFSYALMLFAHHVKISIEKNKGFGKTFMITSILFAYGCYIMIYYFYYVQKTNYISDVFLIYYIVSIISTVLMAAGLILIYKKSKQIKEVQRTRKELAVFFEH